MPTYEYVCTENGHRIEVFLRFGEEVPTTCEVCGSALRKVFLPAGILFKGSGFYKTDSRTSSKKSDSKLEPAKSSSSSDSKSSDSTSSPSESRSSGDSGSSGSSGSRSASSTKEKSA